MPIDWNDPDYVFLRKRLEVGRAILFAGAGFSCDARNRHGDQPPMGKDLAQRLANEAGFPFSGEPLPIVYEAAEPQIGGNNLWRLLGELYSIEEFAEWYAIVRNITWYRVYTLNIDNLFQRLYSKPDGQTLRTIVNPSPVEERDPHFRNLQCVHLHGYVENRHAGVTFTLPDFARLTASPNAWYQTLADDILNRTTIFVGTTLEEPMFHHYLELREPKERNAKEVRPKSFLVCPGIGAIRSRTLSHRNIIAIDSTGAEFFSSLAETSDDDTFSLKRVRGQAFPYAIFRDAARHTDESINRHFHHIVPDELPYTYSAPADAFFTGSEPDWYDIAENRDAERRITGELVERLGSIRDRFSCFVLHGPAGCGKTTTSMRVAHELAQHGELVFFGKGLERLDLSGILSIETEQREQGKRLFVIVDILSRHTSALENYRDQLLKADSLTLLLVDRTNRYVKKGQSVSALSPEELRMPDLDETDVRSVLKTLKTFGYLGSLRDKPQDEQIRAFMTRAEKQLLVALKEATSGEGFDIILQTEFSELEDQAQLAYTIAALAVAHGAPGVYLRHLTPCLDRSQFTKQVVISDLLRGVLVPANQSRTMVKPRHGLIAYWVATYIAPIGVKVQAITRFLQQISGDIIPNEIRRRSPAFVAYRGLINSAGMRQTFSNDHEIILGIYDEVKPYYDHDFLFWLQHGMAHMDAGRLDIAENYMNQSLAIRPRGHQTLHQLGCLYLIQSQRNANPATAVERAEEGRRLLLDQIREKGDDNSYPYHAYLTHVGRWYRHAGDLVEKRQWEELRKIAALANAKYGRDDMVRDAIKEVDKLYMLRAVSTPPEQT